MTLARCTPITMATCDGLKEMDRPPVAIVVRIATNLPGASPLHFPQTEGHRPMVFALTATEEDAAEAQRLGCDVVLRAPQQVRALYEALMQVS